MTGLNFCCGPVLAQDGIHAGIARPAVQDDVLPQYAFQLHSNFFHHAPGSGVLDIATRFDAVELQGVESVIEHGAHGFGHQPLAPVLAGKRVADLAARVHCADLVECATANDDAVAEVLDTPGRAEARRHIPAACAGDTRACHRASGVAPRRRIVSSAGRWRRRRCRRHLPCAGGAAAGAACGDRGSCGLRLASGACIGAA